VCFDLGFEVIFDLDGICVEGSFSKLCVSYAGELVHEDADYFV
jgi:hypothetical protein